MRLATIAIILSFCLAACQTPRNDSAAASFLVQLNERVAGYMYGKDIPDNFDAVQYREIVDKVCDSPTCKQESDALFKDYDVKAKKVGSFFSVLLCDTATHDKVMEDYSCNHMKVEVRSWESQKPQACNFAADWKDIYDRECQ